MIKFIPKLTETPNIGIPKPETFVDNLTNKGVAKQLEAKLGDKSCPEHPDFENRMLVHVSNEGDIMTVQSYCCDNFKEKLEMIAQNKNPFPSDTTKDS